MLKRIISILLLSIYLISITELSQLIKLPVLVEHYIEHKEKDSGLSLWQFLCMHYAHGDVKDADYDKDMKLPFKSHDGCINAITVAFIPQNHAHLFIKPVFTNANTYSVYTEKFLTSAYLSSIWQPPKLS